jgi:hypothetical protein
MDELMSDGIFEFVDLPSPTLSRRSLYLDAIAQARRN